jgi:hypothetical protein
MKLQDRCVNFGSLPTNVIAFPGAHRGRPAPATEASHPLPHRTRQPAAIAGSELNGRLLILLAICTTSAVLLLSAVHILQG